MRPVCDRVKIERFPKRSAIFPQKRTDTRHRGCGDDEAGAVTKVFEVLDLKRQTHKRSGIIEQDKPQKVPHTMIGDGPFYKTPSRGEIVGLFGNGFFL